MNVLVTSGSLMLIFSIIMYLLSYVLGKHYLLWLIFDEIFDLIAILPLIYSLRLRYINKN